jgi:hypothetical protein
MKFACLGYGLEKTWDTMSTSERNAMFEDCFTYDSRLLKEGHMVEDGAALQPSRTAKTLRWQDGAVVVTDGPYAETKEQLGGLGVLEAKDMVHAVDLMSNHPGLHYGATFEIRPIDKEALKRQATSMARWGPRVPAGDSQALKFASLGYINENGWGSLPEDERDAILKSCIAFDEARVRSGQWLTGIALQSARTAKTLRAKDDRVVVTDGPFAETKEYLGGVVVLALKDANDAVASLSRHPALPFGVAIEIRPIDVEVSRLWEGRVKTA